MTGIEVCVCVCVCACVYVRVRVRVCVRARVVWMGGVHHLTITTAFHHLLDHSFEVN